MDVLMGSAFVLSIIGVVLVFGLPVLAVWLVIAVRQARPPFAPEAARLSGLLAGGLGAGLVLFCLAVALSNVRSSATTALGCAGATSIGIVPLWAGARLLSTRALPPLHRPIWTLTVGAVVLAVFLLFEVWIADRARQITQEAAYDTNPTQAAAAIRQDPNNAAAHFGLARSKMRQGDYAGAVPEIQTVVRLRPDDGEAVMMLAHALDRAGRKQEAEAAYRKVAARSDNFGQAARRYLALRHPAH